MVFSFHQVWQDVKSKDIDMLLIEVKRKFIQHGLTVEKQLEKSVSFTCYADKVNEAVINYNGYIYKCTAREFNKKNREGVLKENGKIIWNSNNSIRMKTKLTNKLCLECSIFPLCGGGCSQHAYENYGKDYCIHNFDEDRKKHLVKTRFLNAFAI